jgi:hypothetical protein
MIACDEEYTHATDVTTITQFTDIGTAPSTRPRLSNRASWSIAHG